MAGIQAILSLDALSGGRFEPGLGAGWLEDEMTRTGRPFPGGGDRVNMVREALTFSHASREKQRAWRRRRWI